jgi:internalin A
MKYLKIIFICSILLSSCQNSVEPGNSKLVANAGDDQTTYAGSYAILDPTKSNIEGETVNLVEWIQDPGNPEQIFAFASSLQEKSAAAFIKEGKYKLTLKISCKSGNIYTDDLVITVNPRQTGLIEDVNLEALIRKRLNYKEGELTAEKLQMLDSLSNTDLALKNKIASIKGIENCINITYLLLASESITNLTPLANLTKLEYLDLNQNYTIEDISPIYNLTNLTKLILYSNPIKDISGLGSLTKLKELYLMYTPIKDISSLSKLINLETLYLDCSGTGITLNSIEPLRNLTNLKTLYLAATGITDISPLENLTELSLLVLSFNNLTEISPISKMIKLIRLYISFNKIEKIDGIKLLENLDYLDATNNQIKDISEMQYLPNIHLIGLSGNKIEDIAPLVANPYLGQGVNLDLGNNPLNDKSINEYIPALIAKGVAVSTM